MGRQKPFRSRLEAYGRAQRSWSCKGCGAHFEAKPPRVCPECDRDAGFHYLASGAERQRLAQLRLMESAGKASQIKTQVRYPLKSRAGVVIAHYVADFVYLDESGRQRIEDVKPKKHIDPLSKMKIRWFEADYAPWAVKIVTG